MAWCPKCKNEYIEGITKCADCGVDLVECLPDEDVPGAPVIILHTENDDNGSKIVTYLHYKNVQTVDMIMTGENETDGYDIITAAFEEEKARILLENLAESEEIDESVLMPAINDKLDEIKEEQASQMFSDLRTESSTVYVKKKDKYNDLKFSGLAFIIFGILGAGVVVASLTGMLKLFTTFSAIIMGIVFGIFLIVGITSLIRAKNLKLIVFEEEKTTNEVMDWIQSEITDEYIDTLTDSSLSEEDNYFSVQSKLCERLTEKFPFLNKEYIDQLMDERYNDYCEKKAN